MTNTAWCKMQEAFLPDEPGGSRLAAHRTLPVQGDVFTRHPQGSTSTGSKFALHYPSCTNVSTRSSGGYDWAGGFSSHRGDRRSVITSILARRGPSAGCQAACLSKPRFSPPVADDGEHLPQA